MTTIPTPPIHCRGDTMLVCGTVIYFDGEFVLIVEAWK
jgi:hypothetical protein